VDKRPICQNCKNRKDCFCVIQEKFVPKKGTCEKFDSKK
jgi:hypothetical protein